MVVILGYTFSDVLKMVTSPTPSGGRFAGFLWPNVQLRLTRNILIVSTRISDFNRLGLSLIKKNHVC